MFKINKLPQYDMNGLHILDPNDSLGIKSEYINILQKKAIMDYLPQTEGLVLDVGCGYGRLTKIIQERCVNTVGIDPSGDLIKYASEKNPGVNFITGGFPDLPVQKKSVSMMIMHNLLRALKLMNSLDKIKGCGSYVKKNGYMIVVDNIRKDYEQFVDENWIIDNFIKEGFRLKKRIPIRIGKWWLLYLIRYGLIHRKYLPLIADMEMKMVKKIKPDYRWTYYNVMYIFKKI